MIRGFIAPCLFLHALLSKADAAPETTESMECLADGSCTTVTSACGLYMAESTIPNAGWGVFAGTDFLENSTLDATDILIPYVNDLVQTQLQSTLYGVKLRDTLISAYTTDQSILLDSFVDDESVVVESLAPGLGLLTKSHRGWTNMNPNYGIGGSACHSQHSGARIDASAGASTSHHDCTFRATTRIPAGYELFHGHGQDRTPNPATSLSDTTNSSKTRSMDWLTKHGMCLDHIQVVPLLNTSANIPSHQRGAVARRFLSEGTVVAPAPLLHFSRSHVEILMVDTYGEPDTTLLWKGHQLLLNYCFGHPSSSLLFFPYSPGVNLINHADSRSVQPNVAVRWSPRMAHPEWLRHNVSRLLDFDALNEKGSLLMEYYSLRDIQPGEPLWLDYGTAWQTAWDEHVQHWNHAATFEHVDASYTTHWKDYKSAWDYTQECDALLQTGQHTCLWETPAWISVRCFIAPVATLPVDDEHPWRMWLPPAELSNRKITSHRALQSTRECRVMGVNADNTYSIQILNTVDWEGNDDSGEQLLVKKTPRSAILLVDQPYSSSQFGRHSFRHEIQLPDDMMPAAWRDLDPKPDPSCGLYMAESSIPNSGLGMFTARTIPSGERIFSGEVVVQVEDYDTNAKMRQYATTTRGSTYWLLQNYFWTSKVSLGNFDGVYMESLIPGLGMLANSHVGMISANLKAPKRFSRLQKHRDPGSGSSSSYNDVHYTAAFTLEAGAEIYVDYGDDWFSGREAAIGIIPLRQDFADADELLEHLSHILGETSYNKRKMTTDVLQMVRAISSIRPRLASLIPKDTTELEASLNGGSARLSVPNRIRSDSWLQKNGRCIDNLKPDTSTIRQAGNGAFATRRIKKGDVITPMPLAHSRRHHMEIFDGKDKHDPGGTFWMVDNQLLLNYCYGHPESSLLLFPYSPIVNYVNHNLTGFNAALRWSALANHRKDWLLRTPEDLALEDHAGLIMEMIATREIQAGEEVFLSYGEAWETAWNSFAGSWIPTDSDLRYMSTGELNKRMTWIKTKVDMETSPYQFTNDVITVCFVEGLDWPVPDSQDEDSTRTVKWIGSYRLFDSSDFAHACVIEARHHGSHLRDSIYNRLDSIKPLDVLYTVIIESEGETFRVVDVPRKAIRFFDAMYKAEYMTRTNFRHEIRLPDDLVPPAWRDLSSK